MKTRSLTPFTRNVIQVIKKIPLGRVATYGQIATLAGNSGGARGVVWILHSCSDSYDLPWHRVVNAQGLIALPEDRRHHHEQRRRLISEGVAFISKSHVDLKQFQWKRKITASSVTSSAKKTKTSANLRKPQMFR